MGKADANRVSSDLFIFLNGQKVSNPEKLSTEIPIGAQRYINNIITEAFYQSVVSGASNLKIELIIEYHGIDNKSFKYIFEAIYSNASGQFQNTNERTESIS